MLPIENHISLKSYNTFGLEAFARHWIDINSEADLQSLLRHSDYRSLPKLILGGGSNVLFTQDFDGMVIKMSIQGIEVIREDERHVWLAVGAGVNWHELVLYCVANELAGMENLSLIPGTAGAAPLQNIGAYGVEIEQIFDSLEAIDLATGDKRHFSHADCQFGYRESIFKHALKGRYIISQVTFRLDKQPTFHTSYGAIKETLDEMGVTSDTLSIRAISDAVIHIRQSKLPNPAEIGNAGSFFKNPEIPKTQFDQLKVQYPMMPGYPIGEATVKVPAGWLIEQGGWKGKRFGDAGVHTKQALVLVNYGEATGEAILAVARQVQDSISAQFGIQLTPEVNVI